MQEVKNLIEGYQRFHKKYFQEQPEIYNSLFEQGQSPKFLVISCCDSRVHPAQVMDTVPGDIFVIRNVANLVPVNEVDGKSHGTSAAMEEVVNEHADEDFDAQCVRCEKASIQISLNNLKTFPWIKERYDAGNLFIHGWYFDIDSGSLFGKQGDHFVPVKDLVISS